MVTQPITIKDATGKTQASARITHIMKIFGERLKELRTERKLTQKDLAVFLNVSNNTIHAWECDLQEPSMTALLKLSNYFEVSLDYLLAR